MATLLLADDSVTIQRVIELTFANEAIRVVTAPDGHAATAMLEADRPDIVLADVGLPAVDGYTLAERLKRHPATATIPVLLLTGAFEPIDEARARRSGCNGVLVKPFDPQRVVSLVKMLLAGQTPDNLWPNDMPRIEAVPQQAADAASSHPPVAHLESFGEPDTMPPPSAIEEVFEIGLDDLDLAFSRLDPVAAPSRIDPDTVSDFQRDIEALRNVVPEPLSLSPQPASTVSTEETPLRTVDDRAQVDMGGLDWDLPTTPAGRVDQAPSPAPFPASAWSSAPPPPPAPNPAQRPWTPTPPPASVPVLSTPWTPPPPVMPLPTRDQPVESPAPVAPPEPAPQYAAPTLAAAFSALLAAEQSQPASARPAVPELSTSDAMVEAVVRRVAARLTGEVDRLVREELERLKR